MLQFSLLSDSKWLMLVRRSFLHRQPLQRFYLVFLLLLGSMVQVRAQSQTVFVNELIYDSNQLVGSTLQEVVPNLIEIAGPANTSVNSWSLVFYARVTNNNININQGRVYGSVVISGTIPDQENGYGTLAFTYPPATLTNDPGGIAVVNASGEVTNFISYEGVAMTALDGPAVGLVARQTTVHGTTNGNQAIQLQGTGSIYTDFTWSPLFTKTPGQVNKAFINNKQIFVQPTFVNLSVSTNTITEGATSNTAVATVTASRPVVGNQSVRIAGSGTNINGDDFGLQFLTVTILSGATSGTTLVTIKNDTDVEGTETLTLTIDNPSESIALGTVTTQNITILDDDIPAALTASPTALSFSTTQGMPSAQQTYVLSATALTSSISLVAPPGVEISQVSGAGFTNAFTLSGSTTSATIYVRLSASAPVNNAFAGNITNISGSQTATVAVTGVISASTAPNQPPVAVANSNQTATVGVPFNYVVNAFTDPNGDALTYTASGLPTGLSFDPATRTITGSASQTGVSTVTVTATDPGSLSAATTFTLTVNAAPVVNQPPVAVANSNQTATVGVPFSYVVNAFTDPNNDALTYTASGLPTGLSFDPATRTITGSASQTGVSTVTITATDPGSLSAATTFTITVNAAPVVNQPPVAVANANQTATVGVPFSYVVNAFTDPNNDALTYTASGLPTGLSFDPATRTITGSASQTGVSTVTVTATDPGSLSATTTFIITVNAAPVVTPSGFAITGVTTVSCATVTASQRTLTFTPAYTGLNGQPVSFSVANELSPTTASGPYTLTLYTDNPIVTLNATQNGSVEEAVFAYNWLAACGGGSPELPSGFAITGVTTVSCATVTAGQRALTFTPAYAGLNGQPINFSVVNELASTTASGPYTLTLYTDNPIITLKAQQTGSAGEAVFAYNWLAACGGGSPQLPSGFAITGATTVNCATVTASQRTLTFTPTYAGLNGQPVSFSVANELLPTTAPGPYTLTLYTDNPTITLKASQDGTASEASYVYNWLATCGNGSARIGAEPTGKLTITVLGNPIRNGQLSLEVRGGNQQSMQLLLTDLQGHLIDSHQTERASLVEQHQFDVSRRPGGLLLLRVSTPTQSQTVKLIKIE